jgi:hypothetical protein
MPAAGNRKLQLHVHRVLRVHRYRIEYSTGAGDRNCLLVLKRDLSRGRQKWRGVLRRGYTKAAQPEKNAWQQIKHCLFHVFGSFRELH